MTFLPEVWLIDCPVAPGGLCGTFRPSGSKRSQVIEAASLLACTVEGVSAITRLQRACAPRKLALGAVLDTAVCSDETAEEPYIIDISGIDVHEARSALVGGLYDALRRRRISVIIEQRYRRMEDILRLVLRGALLVEEHAI